MRVIFVGGGLAGLLAAAEVRARGFDTAVLEAGRRVGGVAQTETVDGYLLEPAAGSFALPHPALSPLVAAAGTPLVQPAGGARRLISQGDGYRELPGGPASAARSSLLDPGDKLRLLAEPLIRSRTFPGESLAEFLTRRLGRGAGTILADMAAAGVFGGDPAGLDAAAFGPLVALESSHGSLLRGLWARRRVARQTGGLQPALCAPAAGRSESVV